MKFEISGKGVVCNVYYIESEKLEEICRLVKHNGPGLKEMLLQHSDYIVNVSRGFFADSSQSEFKCILPSGETINQSFFDQKVAKIAEFDDEFMEYEDPRDFRVNYFQAREKDINKSQVAIIEYHNFENGHISVEIPCDQKDKILEMKLVCESVDGHGPNGVDLASKATYGEGIVGSEEYEYAEAAILGLEIDGIRYLLPEATFENPRSRVWLWVYDDETDEHVLDFFGSQALPDPWVVDLIDLKLEDLYDDFDQEPIYLDKVHKFFNQQTLDWIQENTAYTSKYVECNSATKRFFAQVTHNLNIPKFTGMNNKLDACTLLCMLFEAFGISAYDPQKLSDLDEFEMEMLDLETLALGNKLLLQSIKQSFCMHFDVIHVVSCGDMESFKEMSNPSLADAIRFVEDILRDPGVSFN
jgi:hypothetical protein